MLRMLMFGKPGSGKGTLSNRLIKTYDIQFVSCGDILRQHIEEKTEVGRVAEKIMAEGGSYHIAHFFSSTHRLNADLVPDNVITSVVTDKLDQLGAKSNWILDGFPRTVTQGKMLDSHLMKAGFPLSLVIVLDVPDEVILDRIANRWIHQPSGRIYNMSYNRPRVAGKDDETGQALTKRPDDNPDVFSKRLKNYYKSTSPLLDYFQANPIKVVSLSGRTSDEIWPKLQRTVESLFSIPRRADVSKL